MEILNACVDSVYQTVFFSSPFKRSGDEANSSANRTLCSLAVAPAMDGHKLRKFEFISLIGVSTSIENTLGVVM